MAKRHRDAIGIQAGACNPSGIAYSILDACKEIRAAGGGTDAITGDPAVRLMVHQLAFICDVDAINDLSVYHALTVACEAETEPARDAPR